MSADYTVLVTHQDDGDDGWRVEVYDTANGQPPGGEGAILVFVEENVELWLALSHADSAIKRDRQRVEA